MIRQQRRHAKLQRRQALRDLAVPLNGEPADKIAEPGPLNGEGKQPADKVADSPIVPGSDTCLPEPYNTFYLKWINPWWR